MTNPLWGLAKCSGKQSDDWFPEPGETETARKAARVCRSCPIQHPCQSWARDNDEVGVWGGFPFGLEGITARDLDPPRRIKPPKVMRDNRMSEKALQVSELTQEGHSPAVIAQKLGLSIRTVQRDLKKLRRTAV